MFHLGTYVYGFVKDLRPGTSVYSTIKTDRHDITDILLKLTLNTLILTPMYTEMRMKMLYCIV